MADRFKYSEVRQKIIDAIRTDLIGPRESEEVLEENPRYAYLVGMLDIQSDDEDYSGAGEQEVDADMALKTEKILLPERMMITSRFLRLILDCHPLSVSVFMCIAICRVSTWMYPGETIQSLQRNTREKTKKNTAALSIRASR